MLKRFSSLLMIMLLLGVASCGSDDKDKDSSPDQRETKAEQKEKADQALAEREKKNALPICPQVAIVQELSDLRDYGREKPDLSQLVTEARMTKVTGDCGYRDDGIDIAFDLDMAAMRGPRLGGNRASFPFFIAVLDPDQNILNKEQLTEEFKLSEEKTPVERTESLHVFIPMTKDKRATGPDYRILIGFQLTQDQLDIVRSRETPQPPVQ